MAYLGETIKKLGFGLMRLPQKDGGIDIEQVKEMVDRFLSAGFTYFVQLGLMRAVRTPSGTHLWSATRAKNSSWPQRMRLGSTVKRGKKPPHSLTPRCSRPGSGILTSICCIIWAKGAPGSLTTMICGVLCSRKRLKG